jgi:AcrR family transcriptional regulator
MYEMSRGADKLDRAAENVARAEAHPLIWLREEPRARRPSHSRAEIARAALEIADSEGFDAVSMRRVARQLGAGTMTLYHYVRNKDELVALMVDEVMGELLVPDDELAGGWREALAQIATRTHDVLMAHRWVLERRDDFRPGPNGMRHFEQSLRALSSLELADELVFELIGQVDDYAFGYALRELEEREERERGWPPEVIEFFQREIDSGEYPLIARFLGTDAGAGIDRVTELIGREGRFARGLERLLDGIEAELGAPSNPSKRQSGSE